MGWFSKIDKARLLFRIGQRLHCAKTNEPFFVKRMLYIHPSSENILGSDLGEPERFLYWERQWATVKKREEERPLHRVRRLEFDDYF